MATSRMNNPVSSEDISLNEMIEKQKIINDQVYNAISSIKDAIKCISNIPVVATEPETKSYISRLVDEICIHLDEIKINIPDSGK